MSGKSQNILYNSNENILLATDGAKCLKITNEGTEEVPNLQSTHEEADGRMLLHAAHAAWV